MNVDLRIFLLLCFVLSMSVSANEKQVEKRQADMLLKAAFSGGVKTAKSLMKGEGVAKALKNGVAAGLDNLGVGELAEMVLPSNKNEQSASPKSKNQMNTAQNNQLSNQQQNGNPGQVHVTVNVNNQQHIPNANQQGLGNGYLSQQRTGNLHQNQENMGNGYPPQPRMENPYQNQENVGNAYPPDQRMENPYHNQENLRNPYQNRQIIDKMNTNHQNMRNVYQDGQTMDDYYQQNQRNSRRNFLQNNQDSFSLSNRITTENVDQQIKKCNQRYRLSLALISRLSLKIRHQQRFNRKSAFNKLAQTIQNRKEKLMQTRTRCLNHLNAWFYPQLNKV